GNDTRILAVERAKELIRRVDGAGRGLPFDQDMRRAPDRPAFATEEDVAIAAHAGIARPFVAGQAYEGARRIERRGQRVELGPERVGDLKVIALVPDDIEKGKIARIAKIAFRRAHTDGFPALPMQVAPIAPQRHGRRHAQRIGAGKLLAFRHEPQLEIAGRVDDEIIEYGRAVATFYRNALRQSADRPRRHKRERLRGIGGRVPSRILGDDRKPERLADDGERRPDRLPVRGLPRYEPEGRLL